MRTANLDEPFLEVYRYDFVTDGVEGLILVDLDTLLDGEFRNNRLARTLTWNPDQLLRGARHVAIGGRYLYIIADAGLIVADFIDPRAPRVLATVPLEDARAAMLQFRYLFVTDRSGLEVIDVTHPERPRLVPEARLPLADAHKLFVSRTYAWVANG